MGNFFKTVICVLTALIVLAGAAFWGLAGLLPAVDIEDSLRLKTPAFTNTAALISAAPRAHW